MQRFLSFLHKNEKKKTLSFFLADIFFLSDQLRNLSQRHCPSRNKRRRRTWRRRTRRGTRRKRNKKRRCTVMITKSQMFQTNQQTNWRTNQLDSTRIEVWEQWRVLWIHKAQDRKIAINGPMVQEKAVDDTEWVRSHRGQNPVFSIEKTEFFPRCEHAQWYHSITWLARPIWFSS